MSIFGRKGKTKYVTVPVHQTRAPGRANDPTTIAMITAAEEWITDRVCFDRGNKLPTEGATIQSPVGELKITVTARGQYDVRKA